MTDHARTPPQARPAVGGGRRSHPASCAASLPDALRKLDPRAQLRNPVMFVVWVGSVLVTVSADRRSPACSPSSIAVWLWFTVLFANLAEAVAEGRGKAQAESLRRTKKETVARRLVDGAEERVAGTELTRRRPRGRRGGRDRSRATATSSRASRPSTSRRSPVSPRRSIRESGGDRSSVTGGTTVLSDRIVVQITTEAGRVVRRPHDRAGRGRGPAEDARTRSR